MKQIYQFDEQNPLVLNENMLREKQEQKTQRLQTALLAAAGILIQICVLFFSFLWIDSNPAITLIGICYVLVCAAGSGIFAVVSVRKEGLMI